MVKPTINSEKHIVEIGPASVGSAAMSITFLMSAVANPTTSVQVRIGAIVKAIYLELWVTSDDAAQGNSFVALEKLPSGLGGMSFAQSQAMHLYPNKKNVFKLHRGLVAPNVQSPTPFFSEWIAIPKGKQRLGVSDAIVLDISGIANGAQFCGVAIFKEYY